MQSARIAGLLFIAVAASQAQNPPAAPTNLIRNGGFERTLQAPNLWTGVDKDGFLAGFRGYLPVLNESGSIGDIPMPLSVAVKDINNDGLPDLATADPLGYFRYYLNSGTKESPKFTSGIASTPYLSLNDGLPPPELPGAGGVPQRQTIWSQRRMGVRLSLTDLGAGKTGLVAGNYFGDIFLLPQAGQAGFPQPQSIDKTMVQFSKSDKRRWGNVFAPLLHDWDGDGKSDLIVGEGSYSANNVHLLPNEGSTATPIFNLESRSVLALGEGRQQLTPAIADFNGDGKDDLLVADSRGRVTAYLRPANWKKGDSIAPTGYLAKSGGLTQDETQALVLGSGVHTVAVGDLNGDGLFDILVGKPNGRAAWAPNKGTKGQPKFESPTDLTGDKPSPGVWFLPSQWDMDIGDRRGNFFVYANCISSQEDPSVDAKEGTRALKFGFADGRGSALAKMNIPGSSSFAFGKYIQNSSFYDLSLGHRLLGAPSNTIMLQQSLQLEAGKPYTLSFQHKGSGVTRANIFLGWWGFKELGEAKVTRGARGQTSVEYNHANEQDKISKDFRPGTSWSTVEEKFTVNFKNKDLKNEKTTYKAVLIIVFELTSPDGVLYLDDLKLVPSA
ncbi:MAG: VCBS repeat-containing protein [Chthoniobacterales bacterium]